MLTSSLQSKHLVQRRMEFTPNLTIKLTMKYAILIDKITNLTTNIDVLPVTLETTIEAVEFENRNLVFQTNVGVARGHLIQMKGKLLMGQKAEKFDATGQIKKVTQCLENLLRYEIEFHQFDRNLWNRFSDGLREIQERADEIFHKIKGD